MQKVPIVRQTINSLSYNVTRIFRRSEDDVGVGVGVVGD